MDSLSKSPSRVVINVHRSSVIKKSPEKSASSSAKRRQSIATIELPTNLSARRRSVEIPPDSYAARRSSVASIEIPHSRIRRKSTTHIEIPSKIGARRKSVNADEIHQHLPSRRKSVAETNQASLSRHGSKKRGSNPSSRRASANGLILRDDENLQDLVDEMIEKLRSNQVLEEQVEEIRTAIQTISEDEEDDAEKNERNEQLLKRICEVLGATDLAEAPDKKTFKWLVLAELNRPKTQLEQMLADHGSEAAVGRRIFDDEEIHEPSEDDSECEDKKWIKPIVASRYMDIFDKQSESKTPEDEDDTKSAEDLNIVQERPVEFGLWDRAVDPQNVMTNMERRATTPKGASTFEEQVRKAQKEAEEREADEIFVQQIVKQISIKDHPKTGKYLHEIDTAWCIENTKLGQMQIIKWFKRFRKVSPKGQMTQMQLIEIFKRCYRGMDTHGDTFGSAIFSLYGLEGKSGFLDFKDFLIIVEVTAFSTVAEKLKWMARLLDLDNTGYINFSRMKIAIQLMDAVDDPIQDENYDDPIIYNEEKFKAFVTERSVEDRLLMLRKYLTLYDHDKVSVQSFKTIPARIITASEF